MPSSQSTLTILPRSAGDDENAIARLNRAHRHLKTLHHRHDARCRTAEPFHHDHNVISHYCDVELPLWRQPETRNSRPETFYGSHFAFFNSASTSRTMLKSKISLSSTLFGTFNISRDRSTTLRIAASSNPPPGLCRSMSSS